MAKNKNKTETVNATEAQKKLEAMREAARKQREEMKALAAVVDQNKEQLKAERQAKRDERKAAKAQLEALKKQRNEAVTKLREDYNTKIADHIKANGLEVKPRVEKETA